MEINLHRERINTTDRYKQLTIGGGDKARALLPHYLHTKKFSYKRKTKKEKN
jgi:hypothetical protein